MQNWYQENIKNQNTYETYKDVIDIISRTKNEIRNALNNQAFTCDDANKLEKLNGFENKFASAIWVISDILENAAYSYLGPWSLATNFTPFTKSLLAINGEQKLNATLPIPKEINSETTFKLSVAYIGLLSALNPNICKVGGPVYVNVLKKAEGWIEFLNNASIELQKKLVEYFNKANDDERQRLLEFVRASSLNNLQEILASYRENKEVKEKIAEIKQKTSLFSFPTLAINQLKKWLNQVRINHNGFILKTYNSEQELKEQMLSDKKATLVRIGNEQNKYTYKLYQAKKSEKTFCIVVNDISIKNIKDISDIEICNNIKQTFSREENFESGIISINKKWCYFDLLDNKIITITDNNNKLNHNCISLKKKDIKNLLRNINTDKKSFISFEIDTENCAWIDFNKKDTSEYNKIENQQYKELIKLYSVVSKQAMKRQSYSRAERHKNLTDQIATKENLIKKIQKVTPDTNYDELKEIIGNWKIKPKAKNFLEILSDAFNYNYTFMDILVDEEDNYDTKDFDEQKSLYLKKQQDQLAQLRYDMLSLESNIQTSTLKFNLQKLKILLDAKATILQEQSINKDSLSKNNENIKTTFAYCDKGIKNNNLYKNMFQQQWQEIQNTKNELAELEEQITRHQKIILNFNTLNNKIKSHVDFSNRNTHNNLLHITAAIAGIIAATISLGILLNPSFAVLLIAPSLSAITTPLAATGGALGLALGVGGAGLFTHSMFFAGKTKPNNPENQNNNSINCATT